MYRPLTKTKISVDIFAFSGRGCECKALRQRVLMCREERGLRRRLVALPTTGIAFLPTGEGLQYIDERLSHAFCLS